MKGKNLTLFFIYPNERRSLFRKHPLSQPSSDEGRILFASTLSEGRILSVSTLPEEAPSHQLALLTQLDTIPRVESKETTFKQLAILGPEKGRLKKGERLKGTPPYLEEVYLVTALVPSETACFANSPGKRRRTAVWISREVMVERLL